MKTYKITVFARGESTTQDENGEWWDIVWYKFSVPSLLYKDRIELKNDNWGQVKKAIKEKIIDYIGNTYEPIEYEEQI